MTTPTQYNDGNDYYYADYSDAYARADERQRAEDAERRAHSFKVDHAIYVGAIYVDAGFYIYLCADPCADGYLLHIVVDGESYTEDVEQRLIARDDLRHKAERDALARIVREACILCADAVEDWGERRPGTSRLGKAIAEMVIDAQMDREDFDAERDAQAEQDAASRFNRP